MSDEILWLKAFGFAVLAVAGVNFLLNFLLTPSRLESDLRSEANHKIGIAERRQRDAEAETRKYVEGQPELSAHFEKANDKIVMVLRNRGRGAATCRVVGWVRYSIGPKQYTAVWEDTREAEVLVEPLGGERRLSVARLVGVDPSVALVGGTTCALRVGQMTQAGPDSFEINRWHFDQRVDGAVAPSEFEFTLTVHSAPYARFLLQKRVLIWGVAPQDIDFREL